MDPELERLMREASKEADSATIAADSDLMADIKLLRDLKAKKSELELQLKINEKQLQECDMRVVAGLEAAGVKSIKIADIGTVYSAESIYPQVLDSEKLFAFLRQAGFEALIQPKVNWQTLQAWCRERMEAGEALPPPEILKCYIQKNARIRKT